MENGMKYRDTRKGWKSFHHLLGGMQIKKDEKEKLWLRDTETGKVVAVQSLKKSFVENCVKSMEELDTGNWIVGIDSWDIRQALFVPDSKLYYLDCVKAKDVYDTMHDFLQSKLMKPVSVLVWIVGDIMLSDLSSTAYDLQNNWSACNFIVLVQGVFQEKVEPHYHAIFVYQHTRMNDFEE